MHPANWYPDPQNPAQLRWWDGNAWTEHVAPGAPATPTVGPMPPRRRLHPAALVAIILGGLLLLGVVGVVVFASLIDLLIGATGFDEVMCGTTGKC